MTIKSKLREQVKCQLSQDELLDYGSKIATYEKDLTQLETAKKEIPRQMASVRAKMSSVREAILAGWEWRGVDCFERLRGATVEVVRSDTLEVIGSRKAEQSDVQTTIEEAERKAKEKAHAEEDGAVRHTLLVGQVYKATATGDTGRIVEVGPDFVDVQWSDDDGGDVTTYELEEWWRDVEPELVVNRVAAVKGLRFRLGEREGTITNADAMAQSLSVRWLDDGSDDDIPRGDWLTLGVEVIEAPKAKRARKGKAAAAE